MSFQRLHKLHFQIEQYVLCHGDYEQEQDTEKSYLTDSLVELQRFPSYSKISKYEQTNDLNTNLNKKKKRTPFNRRKQVVTPPIDTKETEIQESIKKAKAQIAEYATSTKKLPYLPKFTPPPDKLCKKFKIDEINEERRDRFTNTISCFIQGLVKVTNSTETEILAVDSNSFDCLKNELQELVDHEQKIRFLVMQLTQDISSIQVTLLANDSQKQNNAKAMEMLHQDTRQLQCTCEFLDKLSLEQQNLFVSCKKQMARTYNNVLSIWKELYPKQANFQLSIDLLPSEIESFEYEKPLTTLQMEGIVTNIELVKSHIWVGFRNGLIRVISRAHGNSPLFKHLKAFEAHDASVTTIFYIPARNGIPASVWTSSEKGELCVWNPDTANNMRHMMVDDPIQIMRLVPQRASYFIWAASSSKPIVSFWDPTSYSETDQLTVGDGDGNISGMEVTKDFVLVQAERFIYVYKYDGSLLFQWEAFDIGNPFGYHVFVSLSDLVWCGHGNKITSWKINISDKQAQLVGNLSVDRIITRLWETAFEEYESNSSILWVALSNQELHLFDAQSLQCINQISLTQPNYGVVKQRLEISDSKTLITASSGESQYVPGDIASYLLWFQDRSFYVE